MELKDDTIEVELYKYGRTQPAKKKLFLVLFFHGHSLLGLLGFTE
jgi:hypothetical protein